jgi:hypothetical protein
MYVLKSTLIPAFIALASVAACGDDDPVIEPDAAADVTDAAPDASEDAAEDAADASEDADVTTDAGEDATEDAGEDTSADATTDSAADTSEDPDSDTPEDASGGDASEDTSADASGGITLSAGEAAAVCGSGGDRLLTASPTGDPGAIIVTHAGFSMGCCPEFLRVSASANQATDTISIAYELGPDLCDCICTLDTAYSLSGIPAGEWTVTASEDSAAVSVP